MSGTGRSNWIDHCLKVAAKTHSQRSENGNPLDHLDQLSLIHISEPTRP